MVTSLTTYDYCLLTTHYSLLTSHYSLLIIDHCVLLTTHYSLLTTHYCLLTTYYLLFRMLMWLKCGVFSRTRGGCTTPHSSSQELVRTTYYLVLATYCSLLTTYYSRPLTAHYLLLSTLSRDGLLLITGDHGEGFMQRHVVDVGHGGAIYDTQSRIPLIIAGPAARGLPRLTPYSLLLTP